MKDQNLPNYGYSKRANIVVFTCVVPSIHFMNINYVTCTVLLLEKVTFHKHVNVLERYWKGDMFDRFR